MNFKRLMTAHPFTCITLLCLLGFSAITLYFNPIAASVEFVFTVLLALLAFLFMRHDFKGIQNMVSAINEGFTTSENTNLNHFPLPVAVFDASNRIVWYNIRFREDVITENPSKKSEMERLTHGYTVEEMQQKKLWTITLQQKDFTVYFSPIDTAGRPTYALVFIDDTALKGIARKYALSKPAVAMITMDSADEIYRAYKESEYAQIVSNVEQMTEDWFSTYACVFRKLSGGRFIAVLPESELIKMVKDKFSIMDRVRAYTYKDNVVGVTLSLGVGRGENLVSAENNARQALDMALGRGGDQTALRGVDGQYQFFGGVSKSLEKRTKVRSRVVASTVSELLKTADNVLVMGHRFSDLDCIGAAAGIWQAATAFSKPAHIVVDENTTMSAELIAYLKAELTDCFLSPEQALKQVNEKTLLFLVDTHRADFSESPTLCESVPTIVVIDHHRKTVDYLKTAAVFYHEPNASSASEMVTELLEYMGDKPLVTTPTANALLAGICLDTKEFVLRTGVRTFEAAAHLRSRGADTVTVKKFFSDTLENRKLRGQIVLKAENYHGFAISVVDFENKEIRMLAAQAADELLSVSEVDASFVLFMTDTTANISARSMGKVNVQLIMEQLSGGGHQTMAATQLADTTLEEAKSMLLQAIDKVQEN